MKPEGKCIRWIFHGCLAKIIGQDLFERFEYSVLLRSHSFIWVGLVKPWTLVKIHENYETFMMEVPFVSYKMILLLRLEFVVDEFLFCKTTK